MEQKEEDQKKKPNGFEKKRTVSKKSKGLNQKPKKPDNDNEDDNDKDIKEKIKKEKPTLEEIKAYIIDKGLTVDAKQFFDFFEAGNWHDSNGKPVKNWKQKLLTWNKYAMNKPAKQENKANFKQREYTDLNQFYSNVRKE